ncbi:putative quinol monooxygenase [Stenotrophomonas sp. NPDC087984]|uniref:putative quinol monooxygenase n=1 Tax=Streptomyces TaxID=1883 RepID=UPI0009982CCA|nr:putative quinol monooxygenase [Streptomyces hygroscopicus]AQW56173.1 antibiotic biosynthesis monooxygenase [Streptomyces hygroscopicus]
MSDQNHVTVIARFTPASDRAPQLQALLEGMIAPTRSEPGCRSYDLYTTETEASDFVLLERYQDSAALEAHRTTAHYKAYRAQLSDLLAKPVEVSVLRPVNVIG